MRILNVVMALVYLITIMTLSNAQGQTGEKSEVSADEIAKELANPNTTLGTMALPIDFTFYNGDLADANKQFATSINFQPSLPIPLSKGVNLFVRPFVPLILTQPTIGYSGFVQKGFNLGNISADLAVGKTWPSKTINIVGVFAGFPTATDAAIRAKQTTLGPEAMVAQIFRWGVLGAMVSHARGLGSSESNVNVSILENGLRSVSITAGQYFYVVNLKNAWQITGQPTWSYNHSAEKGNRFKVPLGTGVNKVVRWGTSRKNISSILVLHCFT